MIQTIQNAAKSKENMSAVGGGEDGTSLAERSVIISLFVNGENGIMARITLFSISSLVTIPSGRPSCGDR